MLLLYVLLPCFTYFVPYLLIICEYHLLHLVSHVVSINLHFFTSDDSACPSDVFHIKSPLSPFFPLVPLLFSDIIGWRPVYRMVMVSYKVLTYTSCFNINMGWKHTLNTIYTIAVVLCHMPSYYIYLLSLEYLCFILVMLSIQVDTRGVDPFHPRELRRAPLLSPYPPDPPVMGSGAGVRCASTPRPARRHVWRQLTSRAVVTLFPSGVHTDGGRRLPI